LSWNVVDSSGWLEYFADGPNADFFEGPLKDKARLLVPAVCLYEVCKVLRQRQGGQAAEEMAASMKEATVVPLASELAYMASRLAVENKLAMGDAMIAATAQAFDATLWSQDEDFKHFPKVKFKAKVR
jgi:predicted nucleic acid-binding protein